MEEKTKEVKYFTKTCELCGKEISGFTEPQIDYRMRIHKLGHNKNEETQ